MSTVNLEHPSLADVGRAVEPDDFGDLADLYVAAMHKRAPRKVPVPRKAGWLTSTPPTEA